MPIVSRLEDTTQLGQMLGHGYDNADNPTTTTLSSGLLLSRTFDSHNRLLSLGDGSGSTPYPWVDYGYAGMGSLSRREVSGFAGAMVVDGVGRPERTTYSGPSGPIFDEALQWSPRNLLTHQERPDLAGATLVHGYDDAGRLATSHWETGDGATSTRSPLGGPSSFGFVYDAAENLSGRTVLEGCGTEEVVFTLGDRNRPTSVDGVVLEWDENGHLIRKGNRTYTYDYRGRLVTIDEEQNGQPQELVRYTYDAHNRRVRREVAGQEPVQTVWDGWQPVEEYRLDGLRFDAIKLGRFDKVAALALWPGSRRVGVARTRGRGRSVTGHPLLRRHGQPGPAGEARRRGARTLRVQPVR